MHNINYHITELFRGIKDETDLGRELQHSRGSRSESNEPKQSIEAEQAHCISQKPRSFHVRVSTASSISIVHALIHISFREGSERGSHVPCMTEYACCSAGGFACLGMDGHANATVTS